MKEFIFLYGAAITVIIGVFAAWLNSRSQINVAKINAKNELELQKRTILSTRVEKDAGIKLKELEKLHKIISEVALQNSLTMSYIQSSDNLEISKYREEYIALCRLMHNLKAKIAIRFPHMLGLTNDIYGKANIFWGTQENLLRVNWEKNKKIYPDFCDQITKTTMEISTLTNSLEREIVNEAERINNGLTDI